MRWNNVRGRRSAVGCDGCDVVAEGARIAESTAVGAVEAARNVLFVADGRRGGSVCSRSSSRSRSSGGRRRHDYGLRVSFECDAHGVVCVCDERNVFYYNE